MKTKGPTNLSELQIGQTFNKFRKMADYVYLGYLNKEYHFLEKYGNVKSYQTEIDFRVTVKYWQF